MLQPADEGRLRLARKRLREIPAKEIKGDGKYLLDTTTGETLEVIVSYVDLVDPKLSGATAFTVRKRKGLGVEPNWLNGAVRPCRTCR